MTKRKPQTAEQQSQHRQLDDCLCKIQRLGITLQNVFGNPDHPLAYIQGRGIMIGNVYLFPGNDNQTAESVKQVAVVYQDGMQSIDTLAKMVRSCIDAVARVKEYDRKVIEANNERHERSRQGVELALKDQQRQCQSLTAQNADLRREQELLKKAVADGRDMIETQSNTIAKLKGTNKSLRATVNALQQRLRLTEERLESVENHTASPPNQTDPEPVASHILYFCEDVLL